MRWGKEEPAIGEERVVNKFLIFPKCIHGECRWLERVVIKQKYYRKKYWIDISWLNY
jgi:hypothetical protein